jgi:hypothetical protein
MGPIQRSQHRLTMVAAVFRADRCPRQSWGSESAYFVQKQGSIRTPCMGTGPHRLRTATAASAERCNRLLQPCFLPTWSGKQPGTSTSSLGGLVWVTGAIWVEFGSLRARFTKVRTLPAQPKQQAGKLPVALNGLAEHLWAGGRDGERLHGANSGAHPQPEQEIHAGP